MKKEWKVKNKYVITQIWYGMQNLLFAWKSKFQIEVIIYFK